MTTDPTAFSRLVSDLGRELSLPGLAPDASHRCHLVLDERLDLDLLYRPDDETVWLASPIGALRPDDVEAYRRMLEANAFGRGTGGAQLAIQSGPGEAQALMMDRRAIADLDADRLVQWMQRFIDMAERWRAWIEERRGASGPSDASSPHPFDNTFLKV